MFSFDSVTLEGDPPDYGLFVTLRQVLNDESFAILVLMALFTTFITTPIVMAIYKPARRGTPYKHRTVERADAESDLRVLACFHGNCNIPTTYGGRLTGPPFVPLLLRTLFTTCASFSSAHSL